MSVQLTEELFAAFEGVIPSTVATCAGNEVPNVTYVSQVFYVDENHVALSRQFFNKTARNIDENPWACVIVTSPVNYALYRLILKFVESRTEGDLFESMKVQLEVLASAQGMSGVFHLLAADIFEVIELERLYPD